MKKQRYYAVTVKDKKFAIKTAERINKSYPGVATVINDRCLITEEHYKWCKKYVEEHCRIKGGYKSEQSIR